VEMITENDFEAKLIGMSHWLQSINSSEDLIKNCEGFLRSYSEQYNLMFESVLGFQALSELFGLPRSYFTSLTPITQSRCYL
jgi:hypothetical protein